MTRLRLLMDIGLRNMKMRERNIPGSANNLLNFFRLHSEKEVLRIGVVKENKVLELIALDASVAEVLN